MGGQWWGVMNTTTTTATGSTPIMPTLKEFGQRLRPLGAKALGTATWLAMLALLAAAIGTGAGGFALWILTGSVTLLGCAIIGSCVFATGAAIAFVRCAERAAAVLAD